MCRKTLKYAYVDIVCTKPPLYRGFVKPFKVSRGFAKLLLYEGFAKDPQYRDYVMPLYERLHEGSLGTLL